MISLNFFFLNYTIEMIVPKKKTQYNMMIIMIIKRTVVVSKMLPWTDAVHFPLIFRHSLRDADLTDYVE